MSRYAAPFDLFSSSLASRDPGASGSIVCDRNPQTVPIVSATAETRTMPRPTKHGAIITLFGDVIVGTVTVTVTGGYNEDGDTTFTITEAGQFYTFQSIYAGGVYSWRKISDYGLGNIAPADAAVLDELSGLTATVGEINNVADASARVSTLTAAGLVLTAADTGKVYFINNATGFVAATLPAVAGCAGCEFTFINKTPNTSGNHTIVTAASENVINGNQNDVGGAAGDTGTTDDTISFVANQSVAGDKVFIQSDGVKFFAYAISRVAAGMTFTTAT